LGFGRFGQLCVEPNDAKGEGFGAIVEGHLGKKGGERSKIEEKRKKMWMNAIGLFSSIFDLPSSVLSYRLDASLDTRADRTLTTLKV
jgi:hypothetical protein